MTAWVIIALVGLWFLISAGVVVFTCMLSSRFNQYSPSGERAPKTTVAPTHESVEPIHSRVRVGT